MISVNICIFNVQLWKFSSINENRENDEIKTFVKPCSIISIHTQDGIILEGSQVVFPYLAFPTFNRRLVGTWMSDKQSQDGNHCFQLSL